jgi:DEAD/DEAH box helicase domain-containing protein
VEHAAIAMLPLFAMCDRWDIGGVSTAYHTDTGEASIFIYDAYEGGAGIARKGFEKVAAHLAETAALLRDCPCSTGCPSCIQSPKCGNGNEPLDKEAAKLLLALLLEDLSS